MKMTIMMISARDPMRSYVESHSQSTLTISDAAIQYNYSAALRN
jgi:hypothetical protein